MGTLCGYILCFIYTLCWVICITADEIFESDLGEDMKIGLADGGYKSVKLKCGSNSMHIKLETDEDFDGVIYTRGSFHDKDSACYLDADSIREKRSFNMSFDLDKCQTKQEGKVYTNVLVLQHDKELIMPGDAAFTLECDFEKPREVTLQANLNRESTKVISRISLTDADPGKKSKRPKRSLASPTEVEITPKSARTLSKEEL
ncbi:uncharacterized protein [Atheta coriaria]|uniref:uncharacterized protein isoform X2 n=1 Tax=Dalotia coriaria TaxID=877792 RepID=UPI0031F3CD27